LAIFAPNHADRAHPGRTTGAEAIRPGSRQSGDGRTPWGATASPPVQPGRLGVASFSFAQTVTNAAACRPIEDADLARTAAQGVVARVDAKIVEDLHVVALRALIARVGAIAAAV
jgi:hypothetical protein